MEKKVECPFMRKRWLGDEFYHYCTLTDTSCVLNGSLQCGVYEKVREEEEPNSSSSKVKEVLGR